MFISQRIKTIAGEIGQDAVADIGTDHAYIPIYALQTGRARRAIACDINSGPLKRAAANIAACGLENMIETRLGAGFSPLRPGETDAAVLAGLGGMLIIDILRQGGEVAAAMRQLVLSPQSDVPAVRRFVHGIGFSIYDETMVLDGNKFYNVINCHKGAEAEYTEMEYILGKRLLARREPVFLQYVQNEARTLARTLRRIEQGGASAPRALERQREAKELLDMYEST